MFPRNLIEKAALQGVYIYLGATGLKAKHNGPIPADLATLIKQNKPGLLAHLRGEPLPQESYQPREYPDRTAYILAHATPEQIQRVEPPATMSIKELYDSLTSPTP